MIRMPAPRSVAVAVSGGVDSLYALASLHQQGLACVAIHARMLPSVTGATPPPRDPIPELERQCARLGIPLHVVDVRKAFGMQVIEPFVQAYAAAATPNPCALCNARIKFGTLLDVARSLGAEYLATGHYAQWEEHPVYGASLRRGTDAAKDQSYFLALVPRARLERAVFPLAGVCKPEAVAAVQAQGLDVPLPGESQEICFVPTTYQHFLEQYVAQRSGGPSKQFSGQSSGSLSGLFSGPGPMVLSDGQVVGTHQGLWRYTEGQRKGLGIAWSEPLYVITKDAAQNALVLGVKEQLEVFACSANFLNALVSYDLWPQHVFVRTRYRQAATPATLVFSGDGVTATFAEPQTPSAPGQIMTVYDAEGFVLGGGVIARSPR